MNSIVQSMRPAGKLCRAGNVATLSSYGTIGNIVTLFFEGAEHQVQIT